MDPLKITASLTRELKKLSFGTPVTHVYNPLIYAKKPHYEFIERYANKRVDYVLLGMNPGPFGMVQTGIPFGEIDSVKNWLKINSSVQSPRSQHPKRLIQGFDCPRREVSGARLWGWAAKRYGTPSKFFKTFAVLNYCPLAFLEESGKNRTPDKLPLEERDPLFQSCDKALLGFLKFYSPKMVIGIGTFAEKRAKLALKKADFTIPVGRILHPSPASPLANRGWATAAEKDLQALGVTLPN